MEKLIIDVEGYELFESELAPDRTTERAIAVQNEANQAWQDVYMTDFTIVSDVVTLIYKLAPYSDNNLVELPWNHLVKILKDNGYYANMCSEESFVKGDKDIEGKYIIGQTISGIEHPFWNMILYWTYLDAKTYISNYLS